MPPPHPFHPPAPMAGRDRIIAVGLLTQHDVDVLGSGFRRLFPLEDTAGFDDLLRELDQLPQTRPPRD